ncbi:hypothetical protein BDQ12DRAFT_660557 [Crucibulum laeve]|uniref:Uncharacterized protein n=1 Tax=Crucibulum laeve TaxID=68775 RepID=A0A5C3LE67_9AGAR|nr:hypothetical protein BDQ12DRAFT_660557 [Crucibulum laeve]
MARAKETTAAEKVPLLDTRLDSDEEELEAEKRSVTLDGKASESDSDESHKEGPEDAGEDVPTPDPRFNPPTPSRWSRLALLLFVAFLFYVGFGMRQNLWKAKKPEIVYASRYSKEFKYRPAASPIITETMKDGRIRLRGATPPPAAPTPQATDAKKKRKATSGKMSTGKKRKRVVKPKPTGAQKRM